MDYEKSLLYIWLGGYIYTTDLVSLSFMQQCASREMCSLCNCHVMLVQDVHVLSCHAYLSISISTSTSDINKQQTRKESLCFLRVYVYYSHYRPFDLHLLLLLLSNNRFLSCRDQAYHGLQYLGIEQQLHGRYLIKRDLAIGFPDTNRQAADVL